jgi:hypothetical protein
MQISSKTRNMKITQVQRRRRKFIAEKRCQKSDPSCQDFKKQRSSEASYVQRAQAQKVVQKSR